MVGGVKTVKTKRKRKASNIAFDIFLYSTLILIGLITIVPFLQVITISLSPTSVISSYGLHLFPTKIDLGGYKKVFAYSQIWRSYWNTIVRTVLGTAISLFLYIIGAYPI